MYSHAHAPHIHVPEQDPSTGKKYTDACGTLGTNAWNNVNPAATNCGESGAEDCDYVVVRGDCMQDLYVQMLSYTLAKPVRRRPTLPLRIRCSRSLT